MEYSTRQRKQSSSSYRNVWIAFWVAMILIIPVTVVIGLKAAAIPFFVAFGCGLIAMFWPCPSCDRHVGFKRYGIFFLSAPGVRRCVHCSTLLVTLRP